jgi:hypothetical protein
MSRYVVGSLVLVLSSYQSAAAQGLLESVRDSVRTDRDDASKTRGSDSGTPCNLDVDVLTQLVLMLPIVLPQLITLDNGDPFGFTSYPYSTTNGYLQAMDQKLPG